MFSSETCLKRSRRSSASPAYRARKLAQASCLLRVTLQALTDVHPAFFAIVGVSGVLELAALAWWGVHLARLMFGSVKDLPSAAPASLTV